MINTQIIKIMDQSTCSTPSDSLFAGFTLQSLGHLIVPDFPARFQFQVDIVPSECPEQLIFGLIARDAVNSSQGRTSGFAIRLELDTQEIWDALHQTGVLGALEPEGGLAAFTDEEPMLIAWEVELHGKAMLPRLHIAGQQFLYPAIHCPQPTMLEAIVGCAGPWNSDVRNIFLHPALWREQIAIPAPQEIAEANMAGLAAA